MTDAVTADTGIPDTLTNIRRSVVLAALAVVAADWLFYDHPVGISAAIFILLLAAGVTMANPVRLSLKRRLASIVVLAASILPIIENAGPLSLLSGVVGVCIYTLMATGAFSGDLLDRSYAMAWLVFSGPYKFCMDLSAIKKSTQHRWNLIAWAVPAGLGLIFLLLFRSANPLIESWLDQLSPASAVQATEFKRILFWCLTLGLTWSFFRSRFLPSTNRRREAVSTQAEARPDAASGALFGPEAVLRSLVLFNVLFAIQTVLDVTYLWGGVTLPEGMNYATYAHRGAYPLIIAALLAAAFVLFVLRPGREMERSWLARALVYVWIGQTVVLVVSSILRLDLYVETYSLTYARVAAFVWMFLVALGLLLIVARIVLRRSNAWLITANVAALAVTLYACAFVNFPYVVGAYNVKHSREVSGNGVNLDVGYLCRLGTDAFPAIDPYMNHVSDHVWPYGRNWNLYQRCPTAVQRHQDRSEDWRAWTYRGWRLSQYLTKQDHI